MTAFNYDKLNFARKDIREAINNNLKHIAWQEYITLRWWSIFDKQRVNIFVKKIQDGMHAKYAFQFAKRK